MLSIADIADILGVVSGAALLIGVFRWLWRRRRRPSLVEELTIPDLCYCALAEGVPVRVATGATRDPAAELTVGPLGREIKEGTTATVELVQPATKGAVLVVAGWGMVRGRGSVLGDVHGGQGIGELTFRGRGRNGPEDALRTVPIALPSYRPSRAYDAQAAGVLRVADGDPVFSGLPPAGSLAQAAFRDAASSLFAVAQVKRGGGRWDPDLFLFDWVNVWFSAVDVPAKATTLEFRCGGGSMCLLQLVVITPRSRSLYLHQRMKVHIGESRENRSPFDEDHASVHLRQCDEYVADGRGADAAKRMEGLARHYILWAYDARADSDARRQRLREATKSLLKAADLHLAVGDMDGRARCLWAATRGKLQSGDAIDVCLEANTRAALEASAEACAPNSPQYYRRCWLIGWLELDLYRASPSDPHRIDLTLECWIDRLVRPVVQEESRITGSVSREILVLSQERCQILLEEQKRHHSLESREAEVRDLLSRLGRLIETARLPSHPTRTT
ncbi:hypothetical protein ACFL09_00865 [Planctomycetota bacterium]